MKSESTLSSSIFKLSNEKMMNHTTINQIGGEFEYDNSTNLIIGLILITIAVVIFIGKNNWLSTNANLDYMNCNTNNCVIGLDYQVNGNLYKKEFTVPLDYNKSLLNNIIITYNPENPNSSYFGNDKYNDYVYILGGVGIIFLVIYYFFTNSTNSKKIKTTNTLYSLSE